MMDAGTKTRTDTLRIACMNDTASHATGAVILGLAVKFGKRK